MLAEIKQQFDILSRTAEVLSTSLSDIEEAVARQPEAEGKWSIHQVLIHLINGEVTDWIPRMKVILLGEDKNFPPYDREGGFEEYEKYSISELIQTFNERRSENLQTFGELNISADQLSAIGIHAVFGQVSLANLINAWAVHDLHHINQINRILAKNFKEDTGPWVEFMPILQD